MLSAAVSSGSAALSVTAVETESWLISSLAAAAAAGLLLLLPACYMLSTLTIPTHCTLSQLTPNRRCFFMLTPLSSVNLPFSPVSPPLLYASFTLPQPLPQSGYAG